MADRTKRILCVDDDPDVCESLQLILQKAGYEVTTAPSGEAGLKQVKKQRPDLIIVDLMMEEIDAGVNFVKEVRAIGNPPPMYLLSAAGDQMQMSVNTTELGLQGVFQKPINPSVLTATVKAVLK